MTTNRPETVRTVVHTETYRGRELQIIEARTPAWVEPAHTFTTYRGEVVTLGPNEYAEHTAFETKIDGRGFRAPRLGNVGKIAAKLRAYVDVDLADAEILSTVTQLIANADVETMKTLRSPESLDDLPLGAVAWVYAMGQRRRGIVTKHGKSRVEIAYTTASSGGRVFRKSVPVAQALISA